MFFFFLKKVHNDQKIFKVNVEPLETILQITVIHKSMYSLLDNTYAVLVR